MSDLALHRRSDGNFDLDFDEATKDLRTDDGLDNAIAISIGSFARDRHLGSVANLKPCVGGWWGDALDENGSLGGYVHEVLSGKLTDVSARNSKKAVADALAWLVDDGVAKSVDCDSKVEDKFIVLDVVVNLADGSVFSRSYKVGSDGI